MISFIKKISALFIYNVSSRLPELIHAAYLIQVFVSGASDHVWSYRWYRLKGSVSV